MQFVIAVLLFLSLLFPKPTLAHGSGFLPFFKIDGEIANSYFLQNVGVFSSSLNIPQDVANKRYFVGEAVDFEIDLPQLETVFTPEVMDKLEFAWDFGDGQKGQGTKNTHIYNNPGSHILTITADYGDPDTQPLLIESALITVVPDRNYQLPQPVLMVNGKQGAKKDYNILEFDLAKPLTFSAQNSKSTSSKITSYSWDFGDDASAKGSIIEHQYKLPQAFATVVLRVSDNKGFFADTYINVRNSGKNEPNGPKNFIQSFFETILRILKIKN